MRAALAGLLLAGTSASFTAIADTVVIPIGQQGVENQSLERPRQGMTKNQVESKFGQPQDWRDAVGDPPISSWIYSNFTVYFEYNHVIHSVLTHTPVKE